MHVTYSSQQIYSSRVVSIQMNRVSKMSGHNKQHCFFADYIIHLQTFVSLETTCFAVFCIQISSKYCTLNLFKQGPVELSSLKKGGDNQKIKLLTLIQIPQYAGTKNCQEGVQTGRVQAKVVFQGFDSKICEIFQIRLWSQNITPDTLSILKQNYFL